MAQLANRRLAMTLFSGETCPYCHRVRIVLAEKGINYDLQNVNPKDTPDDLKDLNPYNEVPTLVDRELVLYESNVIMEYLDERFPHPPLRKELRDSLASVSPIFDQKPFFMSDEFSLMDCAIAPLLWRLPYYGIELPPSAKPLINYAERMFDRDSFKQSLTEGEREMKD